MERVREISDLGGQGIVNIQLSDIELFFLPRLAIKLCIRSDR